MVLAPGMKLYKRLSVSGEAAGTRRIAVRLPIQRHTKQQGTLMYVALWHTSAPQALKQSRRADGASLSISDESSPSVSVLLMSDSPKSTS